MSEKANKENKIFPLSYGQQALYFLNLNSPESSAYNVAFTARILSHLNTDSLRKSFQRLLNKHQILRTTYFLKDGRPVQEIHGYQEIFFDVINCEGLSDTEVSKKVNDIYGKPFDLEIGPVFKIYLFKISTGNNILLINMHHICSDGWSIGIMLNELKDFYSAENGETNINFHNNNFEYSDFIKYQRELVDSEKGEDYWKYWQNELSGELSVLSLPTDKPRPPIQSFKGKTVYFYLDNELVNSIKNFSKKEGTTLFVTLHTVFQILLHKYSGQNEIIIGSPTAGRNNSDFQNIVGYFINPVSIKGNFTDDITFKNFLKQIKQKVLGAMSNQDFPFPVIVERLLKKRDASRLPVFQTFFGLQKVTGDNHIQEILVPGNKDVKVQWGKLLLEPYQLSQQEGQFDLLLEFFEGEKLFTGVLKYNSEIFEEDRIVKMSCHLKTLLKEITKDPEKIISEYKIISNDEENQIINDWNSTEEIYDTTKLIHELFTDKAYTTPDKTAAEIGNIKLTYKELDDLSNQLANYLIKNGVKPDTLVGIFIERSLEMIISLLGIMKAGGAYVPIDPSYPKERIEYMAEDSQVKIILTSKESSVNLPETNTKIICTDINDNEFINESVNNPLIKILPENLAYMIYTSGSTGKPKGAMNTHGAILNRLLWMKNYLNINADENIIQKTTFSFDVSVWEFFLPLISGAKLVFAKPEGQKDTDYLVDEIINKNITLMHFVPSMLQVFLENENAAKCNSLKKVICSGEELTMNLQKTFFDKFKNTELHNLYGPTEAAVDVTYWKCDKESKLNFIPIGKPVANTQIYILDSQLNIQPVGIPGELYIGGVQVGKGYYNRIELSSEKFIKDIFSKDENDKLYKTGDLVRYMNDGNIEYLGRIDNQIKIRGFRIELGEIEFALNNYTGIKEAIVIAKEIKKGDKRLISFIVSEKGKEVSVNDIRNFLKIKLPEYMIPSQIILLDELPLSLNGKVDRNKLSAYEFSRDELQTEYKEATVPVEEILVRIWKNILAVDKIGVNDNFFELGGDSIISIQIISQAIQNGLRITPKQIFQYQTIAELASVVEYSAPVILNQNEVTGDISLTPVQHWFFEYTFENPDKFNHSVLLKVPSGLNENALEETMSMILKHHDALRLRFVKEEKIWKQNNSEFKKENIFSVKDFSQIKDSSILETEINLNISENQESLSLKNGPLIKSILYKLGTDEDRLLIIVHHICIDGISWRILLEDIYKCYTSISKREVVKLPSKTTSFKEWSNSLRIFADSDKLKSEKQYWELTEKIIADELPKDISSDKSLNTAESADTLMLEFDEEKTDSLLKDIPNVYKTKINDILLSALVLAVDKWSGIQKIKINLEGHGREVLTDSKDISRTIGWFTAIYPVILNSENKNDLGELIKTVKEDLRKIPENGTGYGILKYLSENAKIKNKFKDSSEPEIIFNYLGQINEAIVNGADWKFGKEPIILSQNKNDIRKHFIEINSFIMSNKLMMNFVYSKNIHSKESIELIVKHYRDSLINIIEHCKTPEAGGYTASDFEESGLNQQELDNLLANLN